MKNYRESAFEDAAETGRNFTDEILESFMDNDGEASADLLNDYSDSYHHETHVDKSYSLQEAAALLSELHEYEETDSGLWESLKPKDAICAQAAYTYGNAVYSLFQRLIKQINEDDHTHWLYDDYQNLDDGVQEEYDEAEEKFNEDNDEDDGVGVIVRQHFTPPFKVEEEVARRQASIKALIKIRIESLIEHFDD